MVSPQSIARIQARVNRYLTDSCRIEKMTGTIGDLGELLNDWEVVAEDAPCRIIRISGGTQAGMAQEVGSRETITREYRLILPVGTELDSDYRIVAANGDVYQVVSIRDQLTDSVDTQAIIKREGE